MKNMQMKLDTMASIAVTSAPLLSRSTITQVPYTNAICFCTPRTTVSM